MAQSQKMFRKAALERLSSPERLDSLMQVTTSKGWIALVAMIAVIVAALIWGFLGRSPDTVLGGGIILREGGIYDIEATGSGFVAELLVSSTDLVKKDQLVARIAQPDLQQQIRQDEARLEELKTNRAEAVRLIRIDETLAKAATGEQIRRSEEARVAFDAQITFLEGRKQAQQQALDLGLITNDVLAATEQELASVKDQQLNNEANIPQLRAQLASLENSSRQSIFQLDIQIGDLEHSLELLRIRNDQLSHVRSPYDARIIDLLIDAGEVVQIGQAMLNVELTDQPINAVVFVPLQGGRIQAGQSVQVSPQGINWEQFGYMLGTVHSISDGPVSPEAMNRFLKNDTLVQQFSSAGGAYLVRVDLEVDASTPSGYRWTSRQGPSIVIGTGMLLSAQILVQEQRPISLVIPALRRWLGV